MSLVTYSITCEYQLEVGLGLLLLLFTGKHLFSYRSHLATWAEADLPQTAVTEDTNLSTIEIDRKKDPLPYIEMARSLKREGQADDAAILLERLLDIPKKNVGPPPIAWWDLAVIYRQRKDSGPRNARN
jgi:hypothetical protein